MFYVWYYILYTFFVCVCGLIIHIFDKIWTIESRALLTPLLGTCYVFTTRNNKPKTTVDMKFETKELDENEQIIE